MNNSEQDIQAEVKRYMVIFVALLSLTATAVFIKYLNLDPKISIALILSLSFIEAALSASYFMHLISERKAIYTVLLLTLSVFVGFSLFIFGHFSVPHGTTYVP